MAGQKKYKVLILTYYFPPFNGVPGYRPYSWYKHFSQKGIEPTIVCRHWKGNEKLWEDSTREDIDKLSISKTEDGTLIWLPYHYSTHKKRVSSGIFKIGFLSKIYHFFLQLAGKFSIEIDAEDAYSDFLNSYLKENTFDAIIVSAPPHNLIRLGYRLSKKFNIPFIADFRDLWDNDELMKGYHPPLKIRFQNAIKKKYLRKWVNRAEFCTTVSKPLADKINAVTGKETKVITNGYEEELFDTVNVMPDSSVFTISIIGTMYLKQDLSVMLNGLSLFISKVGSEKVRINFIGTKAIQPVYEYISGALPKECVYISERLPREEAINYTLRSHVLLYAGWKNYSGILSGKIFDYLGARKNILLAPGDNDSLDELIISTNSGKIANTQEAFMLILNDWYNEWITTGKLAYTANVMEIEKYTRKNQAELFANALLSTIKSKTA